MKSQLVSGLLFSKRLSKIREGALNWLLLPVISFVLLFLCGTLACTVDAEVFFSKEEALKLAFSDITDITSKSFILTNEQVTTAEARAKTKIESKLFTFYIGRKDAAIVRYAAIDTHLVRSMPETFMVVLSPQGVIEKTVVLAFHEPPEYKAPEAWLDQFRAEKLSSDLWPGHKIAGIAGSTLTVRALTGGVRKVLALFEILILEK